MRASPSGDLVIGRSGDFVETIFVQGQSPDDPIARF
jgi:hypothetical protein